MWLPFLLLALTASGSACPDLCECHHTSVDGDSTAVTRVKCRDRVPKLAELPIETESLVVDGADVYEVQELFDELEASESLNNFDEIGRWNELDTNDTTFVESLGNSTTLFYLSELSVTNCSLVLFNVSWHGFETIKTLNLSRNDLARLIDLPIGHGTNTSQLIRLDLSDNQLTNVSAGAFRTLSGLVSLSLRRNAISCVHEDAFRGLDRLEFLDLSDNRLSDLPDSALTPLYSLQKLDLSGNQLQVLGARWFESLDRLRELDVSRNGLAQATSETLQPLPGLSVLKLSENPLKERDVSLLLGTGRRLETVDASRTGLARVPAALTRSVRTLRLAGNKLTTIRGGDLDSYPLLRVLDISDNRLRDIEDDALGRLEVLEKLDISGNVLVKIPESLPNSLTDLRLERNAIVAIKLNDLQEMCNLKSLSLNDNEIARIEIGALDQLLALEELDLSNNPVKTLPANALNGPRNLVKLRMSGLTSLQRKQEEQSDMAFPIPAPERLVYLDVSRSPVLAKQLLADDAALSACKSLAQLNLSETNVTSLRFDLPYMLPQLRTLALSGNDWNCTVDLYWLGEWLRQHEHLNKDTEPGRCVSPQELSGTLLYELPSTQTPLPTTVPTAITTASTLLIQFKFQSNNTNVSSNKSNVSEIRDIDNKIDGNSTKSKTNQVLTLLNDEIHFYEAPTSFRNITPSVENQKEQNSNEKILKDDGTSSKVESSVTNGRELSDRRSNESGTSIIESGMESNPGTFDNRIDDDEKQTRSKRPSKLSSVSLSSKIPSSKLSKLALLKQGASEKKTAEKYYSKRPNNLTEKLTPENTPDSNTIAEELNSRATDSVARLSDALSTGAHPGMLVLVGAALGAAAALTVVLSRRATIRRRDRYHRHENIEVHTLTPTTELW